MARVSMARTNSSSGSLFSDGYGSVGPGATRSRKEPLWRSHDLKAQKAGQRGTIYWVGRGIIGEDGSHTGQRMKGASYHGEWDDNKKNGYGVQVYPSGEKYEGQWSNGLRHGEGTYWVPVGKAQRLRKVYVGGWKDDKRHGRGTCFFKNGEFFQGQWDQGKMHGQGTLRYESGDLYVGDFQDGLRAGKGTLNKANGDCYEGYWLNDKREGSGSFFYASSGKVFVGEWADDLPKAGIYTQASSNPEQAGVVPTTSTLPPIRLALPTEVLEGALAAVRQARKGFRAKATPLNKLYSHEELVSLRIAFEKAQRPDGTAGALEVQALCAHLGMEVNVERLRDLMIHADILPPDAEPHAEKSAVLDFEQFMRLLAILLEEEANADHSPQGDDDYHLDSMYLDDRMY